MDLSSIATLIFDALRAVDQEAHTVRRGYPTGLRWLHGHVYEAQGGKDQTEDLISAALCERLRGSPSAVDATTQEPYPKSARATGDGVSRGTCDVMLETNQGKCWIEVKCAWSYVRKGGSHRASGNGVHRKHVTSASEGAARDFLKLGALRSPDAAMIGVLVIGFDTTNAGGFAISEGLLDEMKVNARIEPDRWQQFYTDWPDQHIERVYGPGAIPARNRCWLWLRVVD